MLNGRKIVVVMPAYNAEATLRKTYAEIPRQVVDDVVVVDDGSQDKTVEIARAMGVKTFVHAKNRGYGGNQKTCYSEALKLGADIVVMVHPDYQYTPKLITAMASVIAEGLFDCVLGSRILGVGALKGGMPLYKYVANRVLTVLQNLLLQYKLSEYHTGYRAFSKRLLERLPLDVNDDDFVFDNQMLSQIIYAGFDIAEVTCPTRYMKDSSSIGFTRAVRYGIGVVATSFEFRLHRSGLRRSRLFAPLDNGKNSHD